MSLNISGPGQIPSQDNPRATAAEALASNIKKWLTVKDDANVVKFVDIAIKTNQLPAVLTLLKISPQRISPENKNKENIADTLKSWHQENLKAASASNSIPTANRTTSSKPITQHKVSSSQMLGSTSNKVAYVAKSAVKPSTQKSGLDEFNEGLTEFKKAFSDHNIAHFDEAIEKMAKALTKPADDWAGTTLGKSQGPATAKHEDKEYLIDHLKEVKKEHDKAEKAIFYNLEPGIKDTDKKREPTENEMKFLDNAAFSASLWIRKLSKQPYTS